MLLFVLYACLRLLIDLAVAPLCDRAGDQAELLVLRHQIRALERQVKVVRWRQADRLVLTALERRLPRPSWSTLLVRPETVLSWHRELVRRKWATFAGRPRRGRPSISEEHRELICQLAKEMLASNCTSNSTSWGSRMDAGRACDQLAAGFFDFVGDHDAISTARSPAS